MRDLQDVSYMIIEASRLRQEWINWSENPVCRKDRSQFADAVRNVNALAGVIKTLRWVRGDPQIETPLE